MKKETPLSPRLARYDMVTEFDEALEHSLERGKRTKVLLRTGKGSLIPVVNVAAATD